MYMVILKKHLLYVKIGKQNFSRFLCKERLYIKIRTMSKILASGKGSL